MNPTWSKGCFSPIGASIVQGGVNFNLFSRHASFVELLLFDHEEDACPSTTIRLTPAMHRTYHYWHVFVSGVKAGQLYGYRVHGPNDPKRGLRFDSDKLVLDPYGRGVVVPAGYRRSDASSPGDNVATAMKNVVVDPQQYDWEGDVPLQHPCANTIIYELHVGGFTRHPNSGIAPEKRGTYAGLIEKIPYLKALGITAVELLPVFHFDAQDAPAGKSNYWGYAPVSFFAPHPSYSSDRSPLGPINEFRDMVKALHRAGIEVILDVVFNHTAEGDQRGPTLSFRGIDNPSYYILENGGEHYANFTGCGNTLNANQSVVRRMIIDSLRYWVHEMHVDGFRFDLASILTRDSSGTPLPNPPVLWDIESHPALAGTKLLAEAWDAAGLYQVGCFVGDSWREWNGRFRDDVRDFFRGQPGSVRRIADRILGSPEIYGHENREVEQSVNFVTCHDGFTLNDLVSYNEKHNEENGENNRDGSNDNRSWNCGVEGPSSEDAVERLRNRQIKNFLTTTLMSLGLPMLLMGDEVRRTQKGNNNAYCQDNELSWFDWKDVDRHHEIFRFTQMLCAQRVRRDVCHERQRIGLTDVIRSAEKAWHGVKLHEPDWSDRSYAIALSAAVKSRNLLFYVAMNAYWEPLTFELPPTKTPWRRWIDTGLASPEDIVDWELAPSIEDGHYHTHDHSVVWLFTEL